MRQQISQASLAILISLLLSACGGSGMPVRLSVGDPLPEFSLPSLEGAKIDSDSFAGKPMLLNFWATWCQPCLKEIPELKQLATDDRLQVVGIALDQEGAQAVRPFVQNHQMRYPILLGDQEIFQRLGGLSIPYTLLVDPELRITSVYRGPATREEILQDLEKSLEAQ